MNADEWNPDRAAHGHGGSVNRVWRAIGALGAVAGTIGWLAVAVALLILGVVSAWQTVTAG